MPKSTRNIEGWLKDGESPLPRLLAQARRLQRVEDQLRGALDPRLAGEVKVAGVDGGTLTLVTPRAGVAARLRLEGPAILRALQGSGAGTLREVKVRVAPMPASGGGERERRELSPTAREALERYARDNGFESLEALLENPDRED